MANYAIKQYGEFLMKTLKKKIKAKRVKMDDYEVIETHEYSNGKTKTIISLVKNDEAQPPLFILEE